MNFIIVYFTWLVTYCWFFISIYSGLTQGQSVIVITTNKEVLELESLWVTQL